MGGYKGVCRVLWAVVRMLCGCPSVPHGCQNVAWVVAMSLLGCSGLSSIGCCYVVVRVFVCL